MTRLEVSYDAIVFHVGVLGFLGCAHGVAPRTHISEDPLVAHLEILGFHDPGCLSENSSSAMCWSMSAEFWFAFFHECLSALFIIITIKNRADIVIQRLKIPS